MMRVTTTTAPQRDHSKTMELTAETINETETNPSRTTSDNGDNNNDVDFDVEAARNIQNNDGFEMTPIAAAAAAAAAVDASEEDDFPSEELHDKLAPMASEIISLGSSKGSGHGTNHQQHQHHHGGGPHHLPHLPFDHHHHREREKAKRVSMVTDLSTGKEGGARAQNIMLRSSNTSSGGGGKKAGGGGPRTAGDRRIRKQSWVRRVRHPFAAAAQQDSANNNNNDLQHSDDEPEVSLSRHGRYMIQRRKLSRSDDSDDDDLESGGRGQQQQQPQPTQQYCLNAVREKDYKSRLLAWLGISDDGNVYDDLSGSTVCSCFGVSPNSLVTQYLHWTFRSSFLAIFLSAGLVFLALTMLFAGFIYLIFINHPTCVGGVEGNFFTDSFALSWTTFSTVGYGVVYSGISAVEPNILECTGMTIVVTIEAFIGVLYAGFCGAILFAKVSRIQSHAQVIFSDPLVIRYGSGVIIETDDQNDNTSVDGSVDGEPQDLPCPVIEFRVVNRLNGTQGGELLDASMNIVACIDASQACVSVQNALRRRRRGKKGKRGGARSRSNGGVSLLRSRTQASRKREEQNNAILGSRISPPKVSSASSLLSLIRSQHELVSTRAHQAFDEDPTGYLVPRRIFSKLEVESPDHPYFKRVWVVRHKLDEFSPLLKTFAREAIKNNGGFWPRELNNAEGVRSSVQFDQILVSFSGTSNADANSVYAQKVYDFVDMNVGYRFVNILYRDGHDGSLHVDTRLINDVMEQAGGGGESLESKPVIPIEDRAKDSVVL